MGTHYNNPGKVKDFSREAINNTQLLDRLLENIAPINFQALAFPEMASIINRMEAIDIEADGQLKEYKDLQAQLAKKKVTRSTYMIIVLDQLKQLVEEQSFGLAKHNGLIHIYNGTHWNEVSKDQFSHFLGEACIRYGMDKYKCRDHQFRKDLLLQFLSEAYLNTEPKNDKVTLINLRNGTFHVNIEGGSELKDFKKEDWLTHILPFDYSPGAKSPLFNKYLDEVLPDQEKQRVLAEFTASVFVKPSTMKLEKMLVLLGSGSNGKSLYSDIINALLGSENVSNYGLKDLCNDDKYSRAHIGNKLLNYSSELSSSIDVNNFKLLASGEPAQARSPYKEPVMLRNYAKLACNTNILPKDTEKSTGYFRRWLIIEFDQTIPPEKQDRTLVGRIIDNELPAIFNWVLDGLSRLLDQKGFSKCTAAEKALVKYRDNSDSVMMFTKDLAYKPNEAEMMDLKMMYSDYTHYCFEEGNKPVSNKNFRARLEGIGFKSKRFNTGFKVYAERKRIDDGF
jgi:putative DNA primase/helicase